MQLLKQGGSKQDASLKLESILCINNKNESLLDLMAMNSQQKIS